MANVNQIKVGTTTYDIEDTVVRSTKQDKLESGVNIKTINGESVLGSGNLEISGGTKLYHHKIEAQVVNEGDSLHNAQWSSPVDTTWGDCYYCYFEIISTRSTPYTSFVEVVTPNLRTQLPLYVGGMIVRNLEGEGDEREPRTIADIDRDQPNVEGSKLEGYYIGGGGSFVDEHGEFTCSGYEMPPIDGTAVIDTVTPL